MIQRVILIKTNVRLAQEVLEVYHSPKQMVESSVIAQDLSFFKVIHPLELIAYRLAAIDCDVSDHIFVGEISAAVKEFYL